MAKVICPKCEKDDQIQKVISIVTNGISSINYQTYSGNKTAVSATNLATRLSPPINTKKVEGFGVWFAGWIMLLIILGFILSGVFKVETGSAVMISGVISGILIWLGYRHDVNKRNEFDVEIQKKMKKYIELYYCYRDDCIFDPRTNKAVSPENKESLL